MQQRTTTRKENFCGEPISDRCSLSVPGAVPAMMEMDSSWAGKHSLPIGSAKKANKKVASGARSHRARRTVDKTDFGVGDLLTDRSERRAPARLRKMPVDPTGADLISSPNIPTDLRLKKSKRPVVPEALRMKTADAELLAPPEAVKEAIALGQPSNSQVAEYAGQLQAELTQMLHVADEAASAAQTQLVIMKAESAAQDKRHAEALSKAQGEAEQMRVEHRVQLATMATELARAEEQAAEAGRLQRLLDEKEEDYASELQRWVVDLNTTHTKKLSEAVAAEAEKHARDKATSLERLEAQHTSERDEWQAKVAALEERLRGLGAELEC